MFVLYALPTYIEDDVVQSVIIFEEFNKTPSVVLHYRLNRLRRRTTGTYRYFSRISLFIIKRDRRRRGKALIKRQQNY